MALVFGFAKMLIANPKIIKGISIKTGIKN
jgi:hypothetical protein